MAFGLCGKGDGSRKGGGFKKGGDMFHSWSEIHKFLRELDIMQFEEIAKHYTNGISTAVSRRTWAEDSSIAVVGQEITGHQLLGLCFSDRLELGKYDEHVVRKLRGSCAAIAATKGYSPAQAVALMLLQNTDSKLLRTVVSKDQEWQRNAVSTGYVLAWKFAHEHPEEHALALNRFREAGGYNTHYIYVKDGDKLNYTHSGLAHHPLGWLSTSHPLHHAAALGDVPRITDLLGCGYGVNSLDAGGETPLQRACMAGSSPAVRCLIRHGADATIKSPRLGTVALHWLFLFQPEEISTIAALLTEQRAVLDEVSSAASEAFHFPFRWPAGTPLEWAVFSNCSEAVDVLLGLCSASQVYSGLDLIGDFFPGPPDWTLQVYGGAGRNFVQDPNRNLFRIWIYSSTEAYRLPVIRDCPGYQQQLESLAAGRAGWTGSPLVPVNDGLGIGVRHQIIVADSVSTVQRLIDTGVDRNHFSNNETETSALKTAIYQKDAEAVQRLLDSGAPFDGSDTPRQSSPLRTAVRNHLGIVKMLLEAGADVNALSGGQNNQATAVFEAAKSANSAAVKLLLEFGADPTIQSANFGNALEAAAHSNSLEIVELFLEWGVSPDTPCVGFNIGNALQTAASFGSLKIVRALLDKGADPNLQGGFYGTTIQAAISPLKHLPWGGQEAVVQLVLERGADVTIPGGKYGSVMQAAASAGDHKLAKILLDAGAPVDIAGGPHGSALQAAIYTDNPKLTQLLLDHGADPDIGGDSRWEAPLQVAVYHGNESNVEILLRKGADPSVRGGVDGNALATARKSGNATILRMLREWGAEDESEPAQWLSVLNKCSTAPMSHSDLSHVRFLLTHCFKTYTRQPLRPPVLTAGELANKIIDLAEYWLPKLSERHVKTEVSKATPDTPYLQVKTTNWPSPHTRVCQVVFRIKTRTERSTPHDDSHTWFEVGVSSQPRVIVLHRSFRGLPTERTHNIVWDLGNRDPRISKFIAGLKPGDTIDIFTKSSTLPCANYVDSMQVIVFYRHLSSSIPR